MATQSWTVAPISDTDANWRLWTKSIYDAFIAFGWVDEAATGDIDFTTTVKPVAINTFRTTDFVILRMADALQASFPVFLKLEFGSGSISTNSPGLRLTIGTAHNGSGTLTGTQVTTALVCAVGSSTSTLVQCWASGTTSRAAFALWADGAGATQGLVFGIERSYDGAGAHNADGVLLWCTGASSGTYAPRQQTLVSSGGMPPLIANFIIPMPITAGGFSNGTDVEYPVAFMHPHKGRLMRPVLGLAAVHPTDMPTYGATLSITVYGTARTYISLGSMSNLNSVIDGTTVGGTHVPIRGLLLYE